jgi:magnesium chelatase family protein
MLAKALLGIMPPLTLEEALETTQIHSVAKLLTQSGDIVRQRPFRSPHHTISYAGLIGGGTIPRPGEVSLAHNGILFLDELPEFGHVLEVLRQPLEDHKVTISRAKGNITFPSRCLCIAAMNPCPCGYLGHPTKSCKDTEMQIAKYRSKVSGPLWDRLDIHVDMPMPDFDEMHGAPDGESSAVVLQRVLAAQQRQYQRYGGSKNNGHLSRQEMKQHCPLNKQSLDILKQAMEHMSLSARALDKACRVALTIADLAQEPIDAKHIAEALNYRKLYE